MKKVLLGTVSGLALAGFAMSANAMNLHGLYVKGDLGYDFPMNNSLKDNAGYKDKAFGASPMVDLGVGYQINKYVGADVTVGHNFVSHLIAKTKPAGGKIKTTLNSWTVLANAVVTPYTYKMSNGMALSPFVTAGLGYAHNKLTGLKDETGKRVQTSPKAGNGFAWDAGLGVDFDLHKNISLSVAYRVISVGKVAKDKFTGFKSLKDPISSEVLVGAKYKF